MKLTEKNDFQEIEIKSHFLFKEDSSDLCSVSSVRLWGLTIVGLIGGRGRGVLTSALIAYATAVVRGRLGNECTGTREDRLPLSVLQPIVPLTVLRLQYWRLITEKLNRKESWNIAHMRHRCLFRDIFTNVKLWRQATRTVDFSLNKPLNGVPLCKPFHNLRDHNGMVFLLNEF